MNYYRLTFKKITPSAPARPLHRHWDWYDLVCAAKNRTEAVGHGKHIALDHGVTLVDAIRLLRVVGAAQINREPAFQRLP
jgi:hypothetical protein